MRYQEVYKKVGNELNIPTKVVELAYKSYWRYIKETIKTLDLENISQEEFDKLQTSFNIPGIGKYYTTFRAVQARDYKKNKKLND